MPQLVFGYDLVWSCWLIKSGLVMTQCDINAPKCLYLYMLHSFFKVCIVESSLFFSYFILDCICNFCLLTII